MRKEKTFYFAMGSEWVGSHSRRSPGVEAGGLGARSCSTENAAFDLGHVICPSEPQIPHL